MCDTCHIHGHMMRNCPKRLQKWDPAPFDEEYEPVAPGRCKSCGKVGHMNCNPHTREEALSLKYDDF